MQSSKKEDALWRGCKSVACGKARGCPDQQTVRPKVLRTDIFTQRSSRVDLTVKKKPSESRMLGKQQFDEGG